MKDPEKKVLIVEYDQGNELAAVKKTKDVTFPFEVVMASTISEALIRLRESIFQAVVSDFYLKDGVGTDLIRTLAGTPLIILAAEGSEETALEALDAGANDYLIKDNLHNYLKLLPITITKAIEQRIQQYELERYRTQLENIVEERTNELIDMYGKLQESETNFKNIFNSTSDGMIITDYDFNFLEANNAVLKQFGITKDFLSGHVLIDNLMPAFRIHIEERKIKLLNGTPVGNFEVEIKSPVNDKIVPYEINSVPIVFNRKNAILTLMRNITERKFIARKLFETIIQTEEEERSRIARDLHDEIGPLISALKIYTTSFVESKSLDKKNKLAVEMGIIIRDVIESVKNISNDMSPHVLVNFGLSAAIQNFIDLFSKNTRIELSSNLKATRFSSIVESVIYRIFKELINNTVKHASASGIFINLDYADSALVCNYRDNGSGFDWLQLVNSQSKGMGISNIITRIQSLGGEYEIQTEQGHGFEINFVFKTLPIDAVTKKEI